MHRQTDPCRALPAPCCRNSHRRRRCRTCRGAGEPQARAGRRHVRPVRQVRRGDRARPLASPSTRSTPRAACSARRSSCSCATTRAIRPRASSPPASSCSARRSRPCSAVSTRRYRSPSCRSPTSTKVPFMGVWAAGTPITRNGARRELRVPRLRGRRAGRHRARRLRHRKKYTTKKPGMILINNPWGESNEKGLKAALEAKKIPLRRHREIRDQRRRRRAAAHAPEAGGRRRAVPGRQRGAVRRRS